MGRVVKLRGSREEKTVRGAESGKGATGGGGGCVQRGCCLLFILLYSEQLNELFRLRKRYQQQSSKSGQGIWGDRPH
jgi:hypothetical protein